MNFKVNFSLAVCFLLIVSGCASTKGTAPGTIGGGKMVLPTGNAQVGDIGVSYVESTTTVATNAPGYRHVLFPDPLPPVKKVSVVQPIVEAVSIEEPPEVVEVKPEEVDDSTSEVEQEPEKEVKVAEKKETFEEAAWRKFCNDLPMTEEEYAYTDRNPLPNEWADNCYPAK